MSEPLRTDLERNAFHFVDYGCALGDGTAFLAHRFPFCSVTGIDFSDAAIQEASEKYPQCSFEIGDITQPLPKADVVFSSNTLEHLQDPLPILHSLVCASTKYTILLLPLEEAPTVAEHAFLFQTDMFPARIEDHYLSDFKVLDCRGMNSPYWNKRQLLVVYTNKTYRPDDHLLFDRMYREQIEPLQDELLQKSAALTASQEALLQSDHSLADARSEASGLKTKLQAAQAHLEEKEAALSCRANGQRFPKFPPNVTASQSTVFIGWRTSIIASNVSLSAGPCGKRKRFSAGWLAATRITQLITTHCFACPENWQMQEIVFRIILCAPQHLFPFRSHGAATV